MDMLSPTHLEKLVQQHGETAKAYEDDALVIGSCYLIPNFGFPDSMQESLDSLLAPRKDWTEGIVDIRVFRKPSGYVLFDTDEETTEFELTDLLSFVCSFYPREYPHRDFPEWWTQDHMLNLAETFDSIDFSVWMQNSVGDEEDVDIFLQSLEAFLGEEIIFYKMEDDGNENCGFAPYIFIGDECLILMARRWEL